jgi:hypothetical protein
MSVVGGDDREKRVNLPALYERPLGEATAEELMGPSMEFLLAT